MLSSLEAILTVGKCREMPVAGFVGDVLIMGIIVSVSPRFTAEIRMKSLDSHATNPCPIPRRDPDKQP